MKAIISVAGATDDGACIELKDTDELEKLTKLCDTAGVDYSINYVTE